MYVVLCFRIPLSPPYCSKQTNRALLAVLRQFHHRLFKNVGGNLLGPSGSHRFDGQQSTQGGLKVVAWVHRRDSCTNGLNEGADFGRVSFVLLQPIFPLLPLAVADQFDLPKVVDDRNGTVCEDLDSLFRERWRALGSIDNDAN